MRHGIKTIIWVEKLRLTKMPILVIRESFFGAMVRYDENEASHGSKTFLVFLNKLNICKKFYPAHLLFNSKGITERVFCDQHRRNLDMCLKEFCDRYYFGRDERYKQMTASYLAAFIWKRVAFTTIVEDQLHKFQNARHEIYFDRHPVNRVIIDFYKKKKFVFRQTVNWTGYLRIIAVPVWQLTQILFFKITGLSSRDNIGIPRPSVWVEYEDDRMQKATKLIFWKKFVDDTDFDTVYYLDRVDAPLSDKVVEYCNSINFKWVDSRNIFRCARLSLADINKIMAEFVKFDRRQPFWLHSFQIQRVILFYSYKSLFKKFHVKALIQHQEASWKQQVQKDAIESTGGIMIGFHWSIYSYPFAPTHIFPQHIYFVWGKIMSEWLKNRGNICNHVLPSGLWLTHKDRISEGAAANLKDKKFIIAIFDSSVAYNCHQSPETLSQFYLKIVNLLERNPGWVGVVKSKSWDLEGLRFLPNGDMIVARLAAVMNRGGLVYLDPYSSPIAASDVADISVCYDFNSVGVVAGVHGHRAVHWNCSGYLHHPIYRDPEQKILYQSLEKLEEAIYKASAGDASIGDFSKWRKAFNYFEDDRAAARVGGFIESYMDDVIKSGDAIKSLDRAVEKYIRVNNVRDDFFQHSGYWDEERTKAAVGEIYDRV